MGTAEAVSGARPDSADRDRSAGQIQVHNWPSLTQVWGWKEPSQECIQHSRAWEGNLALGSSQPSPQSDRPDTIIYQSLRARGSLGSR